MSIFNFLHVSVSCDIFLSQCFRSSGMKNIPRDPKDFVACQRVYFLVTHLDLCHSDCALLGIDRLQLLQAVSRLISRTVSLQPDAREHALCLCVLLLLLHRDKLSSITPRSARKQMRATVLLFAFKICNFLVFKRALER